VRHLGDQVAHEGSGSAGGLRGVDSGQGERHVLLILRVIRAERITGHEVEQGHGAILGEVDQLAGPCRERVTGQQSVLSESAGSIAACPQGAGVAYPLQYCPLVGQVDHRGRRVHAATEWCSCANGKIPSVSHNRCRALSQRLIVHPRNLAAPVASCRQH